MRIVVDENIPYGCEAFGRIGTVISMHGRAITNTVLRDVDALIIRSITKVNDSLLEGTRVRFVGTCTIGEDHVDKEYLRSRDIAFSSAPGCNANSVAEYVIAALLELSNRYNFSLQEKSLGIIGVGNVGSKVFEKASILGMHSLLNDPPLKDLTGEERYRPLTELLGCDIITLHTPLTKSGKYPTYHLVDAEFIEKLKPEAILVNTARGSVVDNEALRIALKRNSIRTSVLDVWENEPSPDIELLKYTAIATPHIAGYSFDGKVNGTKQIFDALCRFLHLDILWNPKEVLPAPPVPEYVVDPQDPHVVRKAVSTIYDICADDAAFRKIETVSPAERSIYFDRLRKEYPVRREFCNTRIRFTQPDAKLAQVFRGLGFFVAN